MSKAKKGEINQAQRIVVDTMNASKKHETKCNKIKRAHEEEKYKRKLEECV